MSGFRGNIGKNQHRIQWTLDEIRSFKRIHKIAQQTGRQRVAEALKQRHSKFKDIPLATLIEMLAHQRTMSKRNQNIFTFDYVPEFPSNPTTTTQVTCS